MNDELDKFTGAVDVSQENITPCSREKIERVRSDQWNESTVDELYQQQQILFNRLAYAQQVGKLSIISQLQQGLQKIQQQINWRIQQNNQDSK